MQQTVLYAYIKPVTTTGKRLKRLGTLFRLYPYSTARKQAVAVLTATFYHQKVVASGLFRSTLEAKVFYGAFPPVLLEDLTNRRGYLRRIVCEGIPFLYMYYMYISSGLPLQEKSLGDGRFFTALLS